MCQENSSLTSQCLAFCQALATKGQAFTFKLTIGNSYSFSLDTKIEEPTSLIRKQKSSPSTQRRNARRREKFLESKNSTIMENPKQQTESKSAEQIESSLSCNICEYSSNSKIGFNNHMKHEHKTIDQLDGKITLNSTTAENHLFKCTVCPKEFKLESEMKYHQISLHNYCQKCGKMFEHIWALNQHKCTHIPCFIGGVTNLWKENTSF